MVKVAIYGASGYTGQELLRLLLYHPHVEVTAVTSRRYADYPVSHVFPIFTGVTTLHFENAPPESVASRCDIVFLALPHAVSMTVAETFLKAGCRVVDLSADFRLRNRETYEHWYEPHKTPHLLSQAVYGIPEIYRIHIREAQLVANPGCYPTSIILGLAPLVAHRLIETKGIIIDSKSGVSGAGREPTVTSLFCEVDEDFRAYKVASHRHTPEIEQELSRLAGTDVEVNFTPHLLPLSRGILSTMYANLKEFWSTDEIVNLYREFYKNEKFIRVYEKGKLPAISSVRGSNFCDIGITVDTRTNRVIIISVIDNLIKGASGQAIQNMNIMCGFEEDSGLRVMPLYP
ncbi:MAG: N-acetyl-gamma-glutamyl-phosphate reductase [Syntrophales bacterium]|nr:N-acetyl-gamma-glutamyl-phosphate reductase [Syntrophales bacterium]